MDFEDNQDTGQFQPQPENICEQGFTSSPPMPPPQVSKKRSGWKIFWGIILTLSILANLFMVVMLIFVAALSVGGGGDLFNEGIIAKGSSANKIAVIRLEGIINEEMSREIHKQIDLASKDNAVKAMILRTITPGGGVGASDRIHHKISEFRAKTKKPVVAFMQTVAASGGYYTSVACDKIVAEPTTITGSIGVMLNHIVIKELFEEKLGITAVVVKSGPKKDWPSIFSETTEEEKQYLMTKLITPAYERFISLVADGRGELDLAEVRTLADGSIYGASEALEKKLIDKVGYLSSAIAEAESLAGIRNAKVIEYERPFSLSSMLNSQSKSILKMDIQTLREMAVPQLLYLWDAGWN
jgi:protease IV